MDPILMAALQKLLEARKNAKDIGETIPRSAIEAFISRETQGKFGYEDVAPLLAKGGTNFIRSMMNGATAHLADNAIALFSPQQAEESQLRSDLYAQENPKTDIAGNVAGSLVTGKAFAGALGAGAEANTIGQTMKAGAQVGAGYGAADAYGRADGEDITAKLGHAAFGGAAGAVGGAAISGVIGAGTALFNPARHGAGRIARAIEKEGGLDVLKAKLREMVANGRGDAVTFADLGPHLRSALDFAANASDDVLVPTAELLEARTAGRAARLLQDVRQGVKTAGLPEPDAALRAAQLAGNTSKVGAKVYGDLEAANPDFDISKLPLDKPKIAKLWEQARAAGNLTSKGPLDDLIERLTATNPGAPRSQLETAARQISSLAAQDAGKAAPAPRPVTMTELQTLRTGLQGQADAAFGKSNYSMGRALKDIKTHVDEVLEEGAPGFKAANATFRGAKDLERALDEGHDWWLKADHRELARVVDKLKAKPGALDEFRHGIASGLVEKLQSVATNRDAARELTQASEDLDAKLQLIFGDKNTFGTFMARVKAEREMGKLSSTIGNSATARRTAAAGFDPEHAGLDLMAHGPSMIKQALLKLGKGVLTKRSAASMGPKLLTQGSPAIENLFKSLAQQPPVAGPTATTLGPIALMNLFDHH